MIKIGLTGGIGSGKSTIRALFEKQGIHCIDADQIAREVVQPNTEGLRQVIEHFGAEFLLHGQLNRPKMRETIFQDTQAKAQLETILHPLIRQKIFEKIQANQTPFILIELPLLVESQVDYIDYVIVADCSPETQVRRTHERKGFTKQQVASIMEQQTSRQQRLLIADWVIDTDQSLESVQQQVQHITKDLYALSGHG